MAEEEKQNGELNKKEKSRIWKEIESLIWAIVIVILLRTFVIQA